VRIRLPYAGVIIICYYWFLLRSQWYSNENVYNDKSQLVGWIGRTKDAFPFQFPFVMWVTQWPIYDEICIRMMRCIASVLLLYYLQLRLVKWLGTVLCLTVCQIQCIVRYQSIENDNALIYILSRLIYVICFLTLYIFYEIVYIMYECDFHKIYKNENNEFVAVINSCCQRSSADMPMSHLGLFRLTVGALIDYLSLGYCQFFASIASNRTMICANCLYLPNE